MKTRTRLLALAAALTLTAAAAPSAWALQTEWVATGTVYGSEDYTGVFGPAGVSLNGDSFTADFYIDTSKGYETNVPGYYDEVYGGSAYLTTTPVMASLTINGVTQSLDGSYQGYAYTNSDYSGDNGSVEGSVYNSDYSYIYAYTSNDYLGAQNYASAIGQPFSVTSNDGSGDYGYGSFSIVDGATGESAAGSLYVNTFSSAGVSAAPEPSAWALLIAGVGVCGLTLRFGRRRGWAVV